VLSSMYPEGLRRLARINGRLITDYMVMGRYRGAGRRGLKIAPSGVMAPEYFKASSCLASRFEDARYRIVVSEQGTALLSPVCWSLSGRTGPSRTCLWVARTEMCQFTLDVRDRDEDQRRVLSLCGKGA
jgi:hypothetical protein